MARPRKSNTDPCPIRIVSGEERQQIMNRQAKENLINRLENAIKEPAFSVKDIRKKESNLTKKKESNKRQSDGDDLYLDDLERPNSFMTDSHWDNLMEAFDEIDPLDDISRSEKYSYRGKKKGNAFEDKFAKEYSMVHSLLSNVQKESKMVTKQLDSMGLGAGKKGASGVSKYTIDLVNASAALHSTQLQALKELVNIKKTITDFEFKHEKNNPVEQETVDTSASRFYEHIIGGGRQKFIQAVSESIDMGDSDDMGGESNVSARAGFNISQPIPRYDNDEDNYEEEDDRSYDKYNYISREYDGVDICIQRFPDGDYDFVALDKDGEEVLDYELPDQVALNSIKFSPTSNLATDKYGRKYRIVDIDI